VADWLHKVQMALTKINGIVVNGTDNSIVAMALIKINSIAAMALIIALLQWH
jgi:hypothetical protein